MRIGQRQLTRMERWLLLVVVVLGLGWAVESAVQTFYLEPRATVLEEIADAEAALWRAERLEARAEQIRRAYEQLQQRDETAGPTLRSRSDILLALEELAGDRVRLHAVDPRPGLLDGVATLHLSIEASSELEGLGEFLLRTIDDLDGVVTSMTLTPDAGEPGRRAVRSRVELDVVYDGS